MFKRCPSQLGEHPLVASIEQLLRSAAERSGGTRVPPHGRIVAARAVWMCACIYDEKVIDTPTWLVHETAGGRLDWCRVPLGTEPANLVSAAVLVGDHASPESVLAWLEAGEELGQEAEARAIFAAMGDRIRELLG